jgi:hypothetical protein
VALGIRLGDENARVLTGFISIAVFAALMTGVGYAYYSYSVAHATAMPILFTDEAAKLDDANSPVLFIGMYEGNLSQYLEQYRLKADRSIGITYLNTGNAVRTTNPSVTYWEIINENGEITVKKIATVEYEIPAFYMIKPITADGIYMTRFDFMETGLPFVCVVIGSPIGAFISLSINSRRESKRRRKDQG